MYSKDMLIKHFATHSIHEADEGYYRLRILPRKRAVEYKKRIGLRLLSQKDTSAIGIIEKGHLLALAISSHLAESSDVFNRKIGAVNWITIDKDLAFEKRRDLILSLLQQCREIWRKKFNMVTATIDSDQYELLEAIQGQGAKVFGGNSTWACKLSRINESILKKSSLERTQLAIKDDITALMDCVQQSYATYRSHYHADSQLDNNRCKDLFVSVVKKHINSNGAVVVCKKNVGTINGFSTINPHDDLNSYSKTNLLGEIAISGVAPLARGSSIYKLTLIKGIEWFKNHNYLYIVFNCNANNYVVQSIWYRLGDFRPKRFRYQLHWWFG